MARTLPLQLDLAASVDNINLPGTLPRLFLQLREATPALTASIVYEREAFHSTQDEL